MLCNIREVEIKRKYGMGGVFSIGGEFDFNSHSENLIQGAPKFNSLMNFGKSSSFSFSIAGGGGQAVFCGIFWGVHLHSDMMVPV